MPILGFMLACTAILAGGLYGISAVLNAPPPQQANSLVTSPAVAGQHEPTVKASEVAANRARVADSLTTPVVVKRETAEADAADQPAQLASAAPAISKRDRSSATSSSQSRTELLGHIMSVPTRPASADVTSAKSDAAPKKSEEAPEIANSARTPGQVADTRNSRFAKGTERPAKDARRSVKDTAKRKAVAKRAPIPSKEELDDLIGYDPRPSQEVVVYHTFQ